MNSPTTQQWLWWLPRVLAILFTGFLGIFALDVFGEGHGLLETLVGLLMHLLPAFLVALTLALAWRWEVPGGLLFIGLGMFYLVRFWGRFHWSAYALIAGPALLIGCLFLLHWKYRLGTGHPGGGAT